MHMHGMLVHKGKGFEPDSACRLRLIAATHPPRGQPCAYDVYGGIRTRFVKVDVTSKQRSPFSPLLNDRFEAVWQGCKKYEGIDFKKYKAWWDRMQFTGRKCPRRCTMLQQHRKKSPDKQYPREIGYVCPESGEVVEDKVIARTKIYARLYRKQVLDSELGKQRLQDFRALMQEFKNRGQGLTIVVKDFDGPRDEEGRESWCEYNARVHEEKLNDLRFSFGHGYCVLEALAAIGQEVFGSV
jgi:hypothetical protein